MVRRTGTVAALAQPVQVEDGREVAHLVEGRRWINAATAAADGGSPAGGAG